MESVRDIEERMISFLHSQDHVTPLDGHVPQPDGVKIADYLFFHRQAVVELKTLKIDPKDKILDGAKSLMESDDFPLIFGDYDLETAMKNTPGGEEHLNKIFSSATRMVEGVLRNAKQQIASSKRLLSLDPDTPGIALILNDTVESIPAARLADRFSTRLTGDGKDPGRFSEIDFIVLIQTTYRLRQGGGGSTRLPTFIISNPFNAHRHHKIEQEIQLFLQAWARSQGHNFESTSATSGLHFEHNQEPRPGPQSLQEFVEAQYRAHRYMSEWSEERLIAHGKDVIQKMLPIFIKGAEKPSEADSHFFIKQFTELLEEGRIRGFDLRKVLKEIPRAR
ncbi:hypothetical protein [Pseudomonas extremorientalis]|uniref:Uncharacterized protein n=1 Tax=Pseudomonas extremorientalis TaxID=169669 RepID=A0A1H0PAM6_9PSED|nr:hypothetical protein [Pseudomonas extremorientalis]KAB0521812.1 hypothetical protein F7R08_01180 [Pseudomonas extremorientalis]OIN07858.1 hypothetical protein BFN10_16335 [Pseudomonas extremorientalis]SDP01676.1 hypothetical protein SAMN04490184_2055 [Pseudomonas extremorientalis]